MPSTSSHCIRNMRVEYKIQFQNSLESLKCSILTNDYMKSPFKKKINRVISKVRFQCCNINTWNPSEKNPFNQFQSFPPEKHENFNEKLFRIWIIHENRPPFRRIMDLFSNWFRPLFSTVIQLISSNNENKRNSVRPENIEIQFQTVCHVPLDLHQLIALVKV